MSESENVSQNNEEFWDYVRKNPRVVGIPVSENKGLDLLSALADIRDAYKVDFRSGDIMLTLLGTVLVGAASGEGEVMVQEIIVSEAMDKFDKELGKVLDEGH